MGDAWIFVITWCLILLDISTILDLIVSFDMDICSSLLMASLLRTIRAHSRMQGFMRVSPNVRGFLFFATNSATAYDA